MSRGGLYWVGLVLCLLLGVWLRFAGLTRGASDFAVPGQFEYYQFHPDEASLVRAAIAPIAPFDPPFTAYGLLPVYVLRAVLWAQDLAAADLGIVAERQRVFLTARAIAVLLSVLVLCMTWVLAKELARDGPEDGGRWAGLLAVAFVAFAPGAIQQAHFFIVDGFFTAISVVGLWAIVRAVRRAERRWYVVAGLLVGALGAVRFNGLALGAVMLVGHLVRRRSWRAPELWWAGGAGLALVLALQAYLLVNPSLLSRLDTHADFALSLRFARLEFLQPWTLIDVHGTRYWDHWFSLWPPIVGWPLTLALLAGAGYVAWWGGVLQRLLLFWCVLYFLSVGALPVKAVRYLVPLLPLLGICVGVCCVVLWRRQRVVGVAVSTVLVGFTALYGLAFARVYTAEDSRIQAGRWVAAQVAPGNRMGLEAGAFNLRGQIPPDKYEHRSLSISGLFYGSAYMLCGQQVDYLGERLLEMDWLALVEENRRVQFRAVPELFPVVADFYARLFAGELGFSSVRNFVVEPQFMGLRFDDRDVEPSFLAYDHPSVHLFQRQQAVDLPAVFVTWRAEIAQAAACADGELREVAGALAGGTGDVLMSALQLAARYPHSALAHLLVAQAYWRQGEEAEGEAAYQRFLPEQAQGAMSYMRRSPFKHYVFGDAALACVELQLPGLALRLLHRGVNEVQLANETMALQVAESYLEVGQALLHQGQTERMVQALSLSLAIHPHKVAYNILATTAFEQGDYQRAVAGWRRSLALDESQADTHATLGQVLLAKLDAPSEALVHLRRAVELDPTQATVLEQWIAASRAALAAGR